MTRLLCYIGFHRYASRSNAVGERYLECSRCKKYKGSSAVRHDWRLTALKDL
jgi:hypothetical protein